MLKIINNLNAKFAGQIAFTFGTAIFVSILGMVSGILLARLLGPEGRGEFAAVQIWGSFFATLALMGLSESVLYFSAQDPGRARQYWVSGTLFALVMGFPILLMGYFILPLLLRTQSQEIVDITRWYMVGLFVLFAIGWMPLMVLQGLRQFPQWNALRTLPYIGWLGALLFCMLFLQDVTPGFLALGYLVANAFMVIVTVMVAMYIVPGPAAINLRAWPAMAQYGAPLMLARIPQSLVQKGRLGQLVVAAVLPPQALGLFAVAVAWGSVVDLIPNVIGQVLIPRVAATLEQGERILETARGIRLGVLLLAGFCALLMATAPLAIPILFGDAFQAAVSTAIIVVLAGGASGVRTVTGNALQGWGQPKEVLNAQLIGIGATTFFLALFIRFGIVGAAIAILIGEIIAATLLLMRLSKLTQTPVSIYVMPMLSDIRSIFGSFRRMAASLGVIRG